MSTNGKGMKIRIQLVDNKLYDLSIMFVLFCLVGRYDVQRSIHEHLVNE